MYFVSVFTNQNTRWNKAAAPNNGAAALFYSTDFFVLCHTLPLFEKRAILGNASKKHSW